MMTTKHYEALNKALIELSGSFCSYEKIGRSCEDPEVNAILEASYELAKVVCRLLEEEKPANNRMDLE